jgi:small-conductance mechanosensitive channel
LPVALAIIIGAMVVNFVLARGFRLLAGRTSLRESDILPLRNVLNWAVRIIATILILGVFGFELGGMWAIISTVLAMVAIGFVAVWSLLSNPSSTFLILLFRPFQIGDDIELAGEPVRGRVIDLNYFFTTLLADDGQLVQVPNNLFFQKSLRRRPNTPLVTLVQQLHSPIPAALPPPSPAQSRDQPPAKAPEPNPLMSLPDPATMSPKPPGR